MPYNNSEMNEVFLDMLGLINTADICQITRTKSYTRSLSQYDNYKVIERFIEGMLDHSINNLLTFIRTFPYQERHK